MTSKCIKCGRPCWTCRACNNRTYCEFCNHCNLHGQEPPPPEMQALFGAMYGNQEAMDGFASVMGGTLPPPEFFSPDNIGKIMAQAGAEGGPEG